MDTAIKRFDTMNQFPRVMEQVGFSTDESSEAVDRLLDGILGLPTPLQDVVSTAQGIAVMTNDLDGAVDTTLALNNAFLASSASQADVSRGLEQYLQMLSKGEVDLQSWRTLQETMPVALNETAEAFGFAGASAQNDLYEALQSGDVTFDQFNAKIIELDQAVGGFADRALEGSEGVSTSLANIRTAVATGVAGSIEALDNLSQAVTGNTVAQNLDSMKDVIAAAFGVINDAINASIPFFKAFYDVVRDTIPIVSALTPVIVGLVAAYAAYKGLNALVSWQESVNDAMRGMNTVAALVTKQMHGKTIAQLASTKATTADTIATLASTKALTTKNIIVGALAGSLKLSTAATLLKAKAVTALSGVLTFLSGPIGWVVAGIAALTAGAVALVKWFNRSTEEGERLAGEVETLTEETDSLNNELERSSSTYEKNQQSIQASAEANHDLAERIEELSAVENKSAAEKEMLSGYVEQLNEQVDDLNLSYSEEADMMNLSSEQIAYRLDLMKEQEAGTAAQERLLEISKEQSEVEQQLAETNELRAENNRLYEEGEITKKEYTTATDELNEAEGSLEERQITLRDEYVQTEEQLTQTMENIAEATEESVGKQTVLFEDLSESQQQTVENMKASWEDYKSSATDMFDTLSDEVTVTVEDMQSNLEENQRVIGEWGENIATLAERGVDEGLLETLREAGPESAGHVNALVNASDEELEGLSAAFAEGGDVATDALSTSLGIEESGVMDAVGHLVTDTEDALSSSIESANFEELGGNVADGLAGGISQSSIEAEKASERMGEDVKDSTKATLGINSPSTVFKEFGVNITEGLALGINDGTAKVMQAIEDMLSNIQTDSARHFQNITSDYDDSVRMIKQSLNKLPPVVQKSMQNMLSRLQSGTNLQTNLMVTFSRRLLTPFNSTPVQFRNVGINAMNGLNAGLNAGRARVMQTANNIAANVAYTMRQALRVASPSKVMRDDVGRWIPEGLADGIEKNAPSVYKALDSMTGNMMKLTTPEMALGTSKMATGVGGVSNTTSNVNQNHDNRNFTFNANATGTEQNEREFYERLFKEFKWYIQQEGGAFN